MSALKLYIGDKNFSSWSLRPWLFLKHHNVPFQEQVLRLYQPDSRAKILEHSPTGRVPVLVHGQNRVWESLAICDYAAETFALPCAWPMNPASRAWARSVANEMHAGFAELRRELPLDCKRERLPKQLGEQAAAEIERVREIWREARPRHRTQGTWLFGKFGIADAMYAPVALRFHLYDIALDGAEAEYVAAMLQHPAMQAWLKAARSDAPQAEEGLEESFAPPPLKPAPPPKPAAAPSPPKPAAAPPMPAPVPVPAPVKPAPAAKPAPAPAAPITVVSKILPPD